jgi:hypothetical protein
MTLYSRLVGGDGGAWGPKDADLEWEQQDGAGDTGPGGHARDKGRPDARPGGPELLAGRGHLIPEPAVQVEFVPAGLAGRRVADVRVQRVPVVGHLGAVAGAAGAHDPAYL